MGVQQVRLGHPHKQEQCHVVGGVGKQVYWLDNNLKDQAYTKTPKYQRLTGIKGSPKKVAEEGRERSTKFLIVVLGSLETKIIFLILEALICLIAFIAIPALGGSEI